MSKRGLGIDVLTAARQRISLVLETFPRVYVSYSGGKDSTVMLDLVVSEARRRGRRVGVLFVDLEAQYKLTIDHISDSMDRYREHIEPFWLCLPISLRNAVSQLDPKWMCWDPAARSRWVRNPPASAITSHDRFDFFRPGMEFEELVPSFGHWYAQGKLTACFVGIRSDESLNRYRTIAGRKSRFRDLAWTTWMGRSLYNAYPIYDWRTEDIWTYHARTGAPYNRLYDLMAKAGLSIHQQRICQPYGDDQRKGLWLYHLIEPDTWGRVVARVSGANSGAMYARERGNVTGNIKVDLPPGHTWKSFAEMLLDSMPERNAEHYRNKIAQFVRWYRTRGYEIDIPDEADPAEEAARKTPSWRRVCKALLRNDYWCKGLSFSQTKSEAYDKYSALMRRRRSAWGMR